MTPYGNIAEYDLLQIPEHFPQVEILNYVFMPDHLHILLALGCREVAAEGSRPLPTILQNKGSLFCVQIVMKYTFCDA